MGDNTSRASAQERYGLSDVEKELILNQVRRPRARKALGQSEQDFAGSAGFSSADKEELKSQTMDGKKGADENDSASSSSEENMFGNLL